MGLLDPRPRLHLTVLALRDALGEEEEEISGVGDTAAHCFDGWILQLFAFGISAWSLFGH